MAIDFRSRRVLLTGDSHMEWSQFGQRLAAKLRELGANPVNLSIGGSSARSWTRGEPVCRSMAGERRCLTLADLRAQGPYDVAIISLGTNDAANAHAEGGDQAAAARVTADRLRQLASSIGAGQTWVVGPPRVSGRNEHYTDESMAFVAEACLRAFPSGTVRFIDSRAVPRIDGDGTHVGPRGGEAWASYVLDAMRRGGSSGSGITTGAAVGIGAAALVATGLIVYVLRRPRR